MPEGPTIALLRDAASIFEKKEIISAGGKSAQVNYGALPGKKIHSMTTWGKHLLFQTDGFYLDIHLMLFGSCLINKENKSVPTLHLELENGEINFYACRIIQREGLPGDLYDPRTDILHPEFDSGKAFQRMNEVPDALICDVLLDQQIFSGIGNKLKDEILFKARVHPHSLTGKVPAAKKKEMAAYAPVLAHKFLGWIQDGMLKEKMQAYGQKNCPRDQVPFLKEKMGRTNRNATFCELCEELY